MPFAEQAVPRYEPGKLAEKHNLHLCVTTSSMKLWAPQGVLLESELNLMDWVLANGDLHRRD